MHPALLHGLLVVACIFFSAVSAWRYWQAGRVDRTLFVNQRQRIVTSNSIFQFYNSVTAPFRVTSLPDVNFYLGEMYSGNIPINKTNPLRNLFFVFQPTIGAPVDEIVIWLNGGPGCSSLLGFFQENGRFIWAPGTGAPALNAYSWVNLTNILWVDQPVGTGFSQGTPTATGEIDIAADFNSWFLNFQNIFGIKNYKIYVTGESYAGRYVPYIANAMIDRHDATHFNLSGIITYSPTIGSYSYAQSEVPNWPWVQENNQILNFNASTLAVLESLDISCGYKAFRDRYFRFPASDIQPAETYDGNFTCDVNYQTELAMYNLNPCFNYENILDHCPLRTDVLNSLNLATTSPNQQLYFNRAEVKEALHAPPITWTECTSTSVFVGANDWSIHVRDSSPDPIQSVLPAVIEHTQRVLIAHGNYDFAILANGTLLSIQNMTWGGKLGFQTRPSTPVIITLPDLQYNAYWVAKGDGGLDQPQGTMGIQHFERGLMWNQVFRSGHQIPADQPRVAYRHLEWLLGRIESL